MYTTLDGGSRKPQADNFVEDFENSPRPAGLPVRREDVPAELTGLRRWVCWRYRRRDGRWRKVPVHAITGKTASVTNPDDWCSFGEALARLDGRHPPDGIGFVFAPDDGLVGVDLDKCRDPQTGKLGRWAAELVAQLGTYAEVSPSGTGVKLVARGRLPKAGQRRENVEVYGGGRFFTVTGHRLDEAPAAIAERQSELDVVFQLAGGVTATAQVQTEHVVEELARLSDEAVARHVEQGGAGAVFAVLWAGDISRYNSASEADMALCGAIARLVGPDPARVAAIFGQSALAKREKWTKRSDYRERTCQRAVEGLASRTALLRRIQEDSGRTHTGAKHPDELTAPKLEEAIRGAEQLAITQGKHTPEFRAVFDLARRLRAYAEQPYPLRDAVRAYADKAGRTYDEVWLLLLDCWPRVRLAEGEGDWDWACKMARTHPIQCRPENGEKYELAVSLAYWLSVLADPFPFPVDKLGQFLGVSKMTGSTTVGLLLRDKVVEVVTEANRQTKRAREFRFLGGGAWLPAVEP